MRRFVLALAAASFFVVSLSGSAWGTPTVKLKAEFVPVPGFRGTGNILEAGAALHSEWTIEGTEYGGFPPPVVGINLYLPSGTTIEPAGFPTCEKSVLEQKGPSGCPHSSAAGPVGSVLGIVSFGSERVEESATLQTFYAPGGGLQDYIEGHSPVFLEVLPAGHFVNLGGAGGYGPELSTEVPLVSTVPGAPFASIRSINEKWGSAIKSGKTIHYITVPGSCPSGGFPIKAEVIFDEAGSDPPVPEAVTAIYKAPCPKGAGGGKPPKEPEVKKVQGQQLGSRSRDQGQEPGHGTPDRLPRGRLRQYGRRRRSVRGKPLLHGRNRVAGRLRRRRRR